MKNYLFYIIFLIIGLVGCNEPLPTQIVTPDIPQDAQVDIEVLSPEPDLFLYESGYDTLGFVTSAPPNKTIINISGIRNSYKNLVFFRTTAFAVYIDTTQRIEREDGRLIGYVSRLTGETSFNDIRAKIIPRIIKYRWNGAILDTLLGVAHHISFNHGENALFPFPYESNVKFHLNPISGDDVVFNIPTPAEIRGKINVSGSLKNRNLKIELEWNNIDDGKIAIVVGGMNPEDLVPYPLYKIRLNDTGKLQIPQSLLESFPFYRFKQIVISFSRQKYVGNPLTSENIIVAQSIHNIKIDVP